MLPLIPCCNAESIYSHARTTLKAPISPLVLSLVLLLSGGAVAEPQQGLAMHGAPAEPNGFTHFPYVNPDAPKGGRVIFGVQGSFDSLNPLIVKGNPAEGLRDYLYESLLARANDEAFTLYGLIAESVETPDDRSSVEFTLRPEAKFSDGTPITVDDVIFSLGLLRDHGRPNHRSYYKKVTTVEQTGERKVKFTFDSSGDREMPLIIGLMPILPKHRIDPEQFEKTTLVPPIGSGPYTLAAVDPGKSVTYQRDKNYWGRDLPVNRGLYNFDEIRFDYYRDGGSMFESFKSGLVRLRNEDDPTRWSEGYDFPAIKDGRVRKGGASGRDARRHVGARVQHATSVVRRSARARGADQAVRFRMGEPHPVSRAICAHAELFRPLGAQLAWKAGRCRRTQAARALRRRGQTRDHGWEFQLPGERRLRREPGGPARSVTAARSGRVSLERRQADQCRDRGTRRDRDPRRHAGPGAAAC